MPWEDIGDCGDGQVPHETDWIVCCLEMGIVYLRHVCGEPPEGCDLDWKDPQTDAPWKYISRCESALDAFNNAVTWSEINPSTIQDSFETNGGDEDEDSEK